MISSTLEFINIHSADSDSKSRHAKVVRSHAARVSAPFTRLKVKHHSRSLHTEKSRNDRYDHETLDALRVAEHPQLGHVPSFSEGEDGSDNSSPSTMTSLSVVQSIPALEDMPPTPYLCLILDNCEFPQNPTSCIPHGHPRKSSQRQN